MNTTRTLVSGALLALAGSLLATAPALAGGDPGYEIGTITVDRSATFDADLIRIGGSYTCLGAGDRIGELSFEILLRDGSATPLQVVPDLTCDGGSHRWDSAAPVGAAGVASGRATFWAGITVCESPDGPCPAKLVEDRITLRPAR
jgi:hypothetical protein